MTQQKAAYAQSDPPEVRDKQVDRLLKTVQKIDLSQSEASQEQLQALHEALEQALEQVKRQMK